MIRSRHIALLVALAGCKSNAEKLCQRAADRYEHCVGEELGADLQKMVHDNAADGVSACAADDKTVAMYEECIDKPSCDAFDDCMTAYAERTLPKILATTPRSGAHAADDAPDAKPAKPMGPPGPAVAWTTTVSENYIDHPFVWAANHILVVGDETGLRAMLAGKELWHTGPAHAVVAIGSRLVLASDEQLRIVDAATGDEIALPLAETVFDLSANGGHVVFVQHDETIFDLDVEHCSAKRCKPHSIAKLADSPIGARVAALPTGTIVAAPPSVRVLDAGGKPRVSLDLGDGDNDRVLLAGKQLAISDESGVALLSLAACGKLGAKLFLPAAVPTGDESAPDGATTIAKAPCLAAQLAIEEAGAMTAALGGGIALNAAGDKPSTYFISDHNMWSMPVGGVGTVASTSDAVYTIAKDSDDHIGVVGMALGNGELAWATALPTASSTTDARVTVRDGYLAARTGRDVFVLQLPVPAKALASSTR